MSESDRLRVRYNPVFAGAMLVLGVLLLLLGIWTALLDGFNPTIVSGVVLTLIGALMLGRPYFWVLPEVVRSQAMIGPVAREFPYAHLRVDGSRLVTVRHDGTEQNTPVRRWMAHRDDWAAIPTPPPGGPAGP